MAVIYVILTMGKTEQHVRHMRQQKKLILTHLKSQSGVRSESLPEKKEEFELRKCKGSVKGTWKVPLIENKGFNACLDEILKEKKGNKNGD